MLLAIDVGNSNINLGLFKEKELRLVCTLSTDPSRTADQYAVEIRGAMKLRGGDLSAVTGAVIGSVVPALTSVLKNAVSLLCGVDALILGPGVTHGLDVRIDEPSQLGADLIAGAVGALAFFLTPCLVMDLGTATKISVLDKNGSYRGCTISAGVKISLNALAEKTAQLPHIDLGAADCPAFGTNTVQCMQAGTLLGTASMLDGLCDRIETYLGEPIASVVATGGLSGAIVPHCKRKAKIVPELILQGLRVIYERNM